MSVGLWPVFKPAQDVYPDADGAYLYACLDQLDQLAAARGLATLSSFGDDRPVPDGFDGSPEQLERIRGKFDAWFPVPEGIKTFSTLANALDDPKVAALFEHPAALQEDLRDYAATLAAVEADVEGFHLEPVF